VAAKKPLKFKVGDRVACKDVPWGNGTVTKVKPNSKNDAPYWVKLDDPSLVKCSGFVNQDGEICSHEREIVLA
jgi:hypothetical protein